MSKSWCIWAVLFTFPLGLKGQFPVAFAPLGEVVEENIVFSASVATFSGDGQVAAGETAQAAAIQSAATGDEISLTVDSSSEGGLQKEVTGILVMQNGITQEAFGPITTSALADYFGFGGGNIVKEPEIQWLYPVEPPESLAPITERIIDATFDEFNALWGKPDNIPLPYQTVTVPDPNAAVNPYLSGLSYTDYSGGVARFIDTGQQNIFQGPWGGKCLPEDPPQVTPSQYGQALWNSIQQQALIIIYPVNVYYLTVDFIDEFEESLQFTSCCNPATLAIGQTCFNYIQRSEPLEQNTNYGDEDYCPMKLPFAYYGDNNPYSEYYGDGGTFEMCSDCFTYQGPCVNNVPYTYFVGTGCIPYTYRGFSSYMCSTLCPTLCTPNHFRAGVGKCCLKCPQGYYNSGCQGVTVGITALTSTTFYYGEANDGSCLPCTVCNKYEATVSPCTMQNNTVCAYCQPVVGGVFIGSVPNAGCEYSCNAGYEQMANSAGCIPCPPATYSDAPNTLCMACDLGKFTANYAATMCQACAIGTYSLGYATACTQCSAGQSSYFGASFCTTCPASTYEIDWVCEPCISGTYSLTESTTCTACSLGTFSKGQVSACQLCPAGLFANTTGLSQCSSCLVGTYFSGLGATACKLCIN